MCTFKQVKDCRKTHSKAVVNFRSGALFYSGKATDISENCMCIDTHIRLPEHTLLKLLCRDKKTLDIEVRVIETHRNSGSYKTSVEVINPTLDFIYMVSRTF